MRTNVNIYFIQILLWFLSKNVQIEGQKTRGTTPKIKGPTIMQKAGPPKVYPFPGIKFEGVDYEDPKRAVKNRYPRLTKYNYYSRFEDWRCWYEMLRCIRFQSNAKPVCAIDWYDMIYSFVNECEMLYYNCVLEFNRFYFNGDERECWYVWDVRSYNDHNRYYAYLYELPIDDTDTWNKWHHHLPWARWS